MLLAAAAIAAAGIGAQAALVSSRASRDWQVAVRQQLAQAEAIRTGLEGVYLGEAPAAFAVLHARLRAEALTAAAAELPEADRGAVLARASGQNRLADLLAAAGPPLARDPRYLTESGLDVGRRLAETRAPASGPPDPGPWVARGDRAANEAVALAAGTVPVGLAFLLGALSGLSPGSGRRLLVAGTVSLGVAVVWGVGVLAWA